MTQDVVTEHETVEPDRWTPGRGFGWFLLIAGVIGWVASFDLMIEKILLLKDPTYVPSCSINPILSCGSVMITEQAEAFGFANALLGIAGFAVVATVGAGLIAGARYQSWFWWGLQLGALFGVGFITWLMVQSLYVIGALCPYCMVVWAVMIPIFVYVTVANLRSGVIPAPAGLRRFVDSYSSFTWAIVLVWYAVILALILLRFPTLFSA